MTATTRADAAVTMVADAIDTASIDSEKENYLVPRFGALCFFLATLECIIPKPLPFLRLGIANIPIILAAGFFPARSFFLLTFVKIVSQGVAGGTFFSWLFLFSTAGSLSSATAMFLLKKLLKDSVSAVGTSVAGALVSTAAQLLAARAWIFGESASVLAPILFSAGAVSGCAVGLFAETFSRRSSWFARMQAFLRNPAATTRAQGTEDPSAGRDPTDRNPPAHIKPTDRPSYAVFRIVCGLAVALCAGAFHNIVARLVIFFLSFIFLCAVKKPPRALPAICALLLITVFNLYPPHGRVLLQAGNIRITEGAFVSGLSKALLFESLIFISRLTFSDSAVFSAFSQKAKRRRIFSLVEKTFALFAALNAAFASEKKSRRIKANRKGLHGFISYLDDILTAID